MKGVKQLKRLKVLLICFALLVPMVLSSCSSAEKPEGAIDRSYQLPESVHETESKQVAANNRFKLFWDNGQKCLMLSDTQSDKIWSTIPYDFYCLPETDGIAKVRMESPIYIEYYDSSTGSIKNSYGYVDALLNGKVESGRTAEGFKVTYYFNDLEISVPVLYVLQENGLEIRLLVDEIRENNRWIYSVSLAPFLCSAKAGDDSYLFVPSGSGALMSTEESSRGVRTFSGNVFGNDSAINVVEKFVKDTPVRLPVFGVKDADYAMCGVIGKGAETARIQAQAGDSEVGYSSAYVTFELRSRNQISVKGNNNRTTLVTRLSDTIVDTDYASVTYYPLVGEEASYTGMANLYRNLLFPNGTTTAAEPELYLQMLGGAMVQQNMLGIPYQTLSAATTFAQVQNIVKELAEQTGTKPVVELTGFGQSGLDVGKIAGGFRFGNAFGGEKDLEDLKAYCADIGSPLFVDLDLVNFNQTGKGFSTFYDRVNTVNRTRAVQSIFKNTVYNADDRYPSWYLLQLSKLPEATEKGMAMLDDYKLDGVSLRSLGTTIYSDSVSAKNYAKNGFSVAVTDVLKTFVEGGKKISVSDANAYVAAMAQYIVSSPTVSTKADGFDVEVPFYQMVFKGVVPTAVSPLNAATDVQDQFLKAMESGCALSFTLCDNWQTAFSGSSQQGLLRSAVYDSWKEEIVRMTVEAKPLLNAVNGATISRHEVLADGVRHTVFSNGTQVYVNYGAEPMKTPVGTVVAGGFIFEKGEG